METGGHSLTACAVSCVGEVWALGDMCGCVRLWAETDTPRVHPVPTHVQVRSCVHMHSYIRAQGSAQKSVHRRKGALCESPRSASACVQCNVYAMKMPSSKAVKLGSQGWCVGVCAHVCTHTPTGVLLTGTRAVHGLPGSTGRRRYPSRYLPCRAAEAYRSTTSTSLSL